MREVLLLLNQLTDRTGSAEEFRAELLERLAVHGDLADQRVAGAAETLHRHEQRPNSIRETHS